MADVEVVSSGLIASSGRKHRKKNKKEKLRRTQDPAVEVSQALSGDEYRLPPGVIEEADEVSSRKSRKVKKEKKKKSKRESRRKSSKSEDGTSSRRSSERRSKSKKRSSKDSNSGSEVAPCKEALEQLTQDTDDEMPVIDTPEFYSFLGVKTTAELGEIKSGFQTAMKNSGSKDAIQQKLVQAYDTLRNQWLRRLYDTFGHQLYLDHMLNFEFFRNALHTGFAITMEANQSASKRRMSLFRKKRTSKNGVYLWSDRDLEKLYIAPSRYAEPKLCTTVDISDVSAVIAVASLDPMKEKPSVLICTPEDENAMVLRCETFEHALQLRSQLLLILGHVHRNIEWVCDCYGI